MDLKEIHRNKIKQLVFTGYEYAWSILVHDKTTAHLIDTLFKKSDLLDFYITGVFSIESKLPKWNLPIMYFVSCTKEISKIINTEYKKENHPPILVYSLCEPEELDKSINCVVTYLDVNVVEERVFKCSWDKLVSLECLLDCKFRISYDDCTKDLAQKIDEKMQNKLATNYKEVALFILDRTLDMFSPLMYFFSFRSMLAEIGSPDTNDSYYPEVRNRHLGEVNGILQSSVKKLQESFEKLNARNVNIEDLDSMVLEAPKSIELKNNIEKYSNYLKKCIQKLDIVKEVAEAQQNLVLGTDKTGNKVTFSLDTYMPIVFIPSINFEDSLGLLFLLKAKGIVLSETEKNMFVSKGFSKPDLDLIFKQKNQIHRIKKRSSEYEISRYEPAIRDVMESFVSQSREFPSIGPSVQKFDSLRKSSMINSNKSTKTTLVVYVNNGLTVEEMKLAYLIAEQYGVECFIGSNKILTRSEFIKEFRTNKELHEIVAKK